MCNLINKKIRWGFMISFLVLSHSAQAQIADALEKFKIASPEWKALGLEEDSLQKEISSRDLVIAPQFSLQAGKWRDDRETLISPTQVRQENNYLTAEVSKYFSTGTTLNFATGTDSWAYRGTPNVDNHQGDFEFSLSQNLWRDSFGASERIRNQINSSELSLRQTQLQLSRARLQIQFEDLYWNYLYTLSEIKLRAESLSRWNDLFRWMRGRVSRSAAEVVDLKQISATRTLREIQVGTLEQSLRTQINNIDALTYAGFTKSLIIPEKPLERVDFGNYQIKDARSLESLVYEKSAALAGYQSEKTSDDVKPDLKLVLATGQNGIGTSASDAWSRSYGDTGNYSNVGIVFTTPLDFSLRKDAIDSAKLKQRAQVVRAESATINGKLTWDSLVGQLDESKSRINLLNSMRDDQNQRRVAEQNRLRTGRGNTLEMVTAEQDALEAELTLISTISEVYKLRARFQLFDFDKGVTP